MTGDRRPGSWQKRRAAIALIGVLAGMASAAIATMPRSTAAQSASGATTPG